MTLKLSVVVAFYNEEGMINKMHTELTKHLDALSQVDYELIYINDGSTDKTLELMKAIAKDNQRVRYISFSRNFGKEAGTIAGLTYASGDAVLLMDGDLQHPPYLIKDMIAAYQEGYDVVSGRRSRDGEESHKTLFARLFYYLSNSLMNVKLVDGVAEFRLFSRKVVKAILSLQEYNRFSKGLFSWVGFKEKIIEYPNQVREAGESKFGFRSSMNYAAQAILSFNDKPLRLAIQLGLLSIGLALLYVFWMLIAYLVNPEDFVSGYFTTISAVMLLGGVQLISLGIIGEYIGKIYMEVKKRPHFLIDETNHEAIKEDYER